MALWRVLENAFGPIKGKYVLYRGESAALENGVEYINVSEYLNGLDEAAMDMLYRREEPVQSKGFSPTLGM